MIAPIPRLKVEVTEKVRVIILNFPILDFEKKFYTVTCHMTKYHPSDSYEDYVSDVVLGAVRLGGYVRLGLQLLCDVMSLQYNI